MCTTMYYTLVLAEPKLSEVLYVPNVPNVLVVSRHIPIASSPAVGHAILTDLLEPPRALEAAPALFASGRPLCGAVNGRATAVSAGSRQKFV